MNTYTQNRKLIIDERNKVSLKCFNLLLFIHVFSITKNNIFLQATNPLIEQVQNKAERLQIVVSDNLLKILLKFVLID